jgi:hypothetical protein
MNTLSKKMTARFFARPEAFQHLRAHWRAIVNSSRRDELRAEHYLLYLALRGKDWRKGFVPITNPRKLANGGYDTWRMRCALAKIHRAAALGETASPLLKPFDTVVTLEMLQALRAVLPPCPRHPLTGKDFVAGYPFDAYMNS